MHAIWVIDFNLPSGEFWESDTSEFMRLYRAWEQAENREYLRAGVIASSVLNTTRTDRNDKVYTPADIFKHLGDGDEFVSTEEAHAAFAKNARRGEHHGN